MQYRYNIYKYECPLYWYNLRRKRNVEKREGALLPTDEQIVDFYGVAHLI
jgi:hypothetical protein